ncbi:hypothetical protein COBT_004040, partial [Conglomerata obtusa]
MKPLTDLTGGIIIMAQDFDKEMYLTSIKKNLNDCFVLNSKMKTITSSNLIYKGVLGQGVQSQQGWKINSLYKNTNLSVLFEPVNAKSGDLGYIQIMTQLQKGRKLHIRVTTLSRIFDESNEKISMGFDQEA